MIPFRKFFLIWVLPKDRETLNDWLALMEITKIIVALIFVASLAMTLMQTEFVRMVRSTMLTAMVFIFIWFLAIVQYLMAIEFNTRKEDGKR